MSDDTHDQPQSQPAQDNQLQNLTSGAPLAAQSRPSTRQANPRSQPNNEQLHQQQQAAAAPRRPRPLVHRAAHAAQLLRRHQLVAFPANANQQQQLETQTQTQTQAFVGVPITAQIELAGVRQPTGRATAMPPKRPAYLPVRDRFGPGPQQLTTSLGATTLTSSHASGAADKPNRYNWLQMQQWHAAAAAAQRMEAAAAAAAATGGDIYQETGAGGQVPGKRGGNGGGGGGMGGFHYHFPAPFASAASRVLVVPNPIVNLGEHTKSRLIKIIEALKRFSEKWFSHVLLLLFLASYACLGAYIFISFEAPTEQWEKQLIIETRARIVNESYDQAHQLDSRHAYLEAFRLRFEDYERLLNRMCANGMSSSSLENQWTFWGALFYSMTVFTTIGYGHLTPVTFAGRVATMVYAIFGIPILLMVLADLGKLLTRIIKYAFKKFRYWYNKLLGRKASVRTRKLISDHSNQYLGVARSAFERGFATYIQPYQSCIPGALRDAQMRVQLLRQRKQAANSEQSPLQPATQEAPAAAADGQPAAMESSKVLVTPVKQTKPVSPKVNQQRSSHPLAGLECPTTTATTTTTGELGPRRAQSPFGGGGGSGKRKISAANRHQQRRSSVSRSSSASNVAGMAKVGTQTAASLKRSSMDQVGAVSPIASTSSTVEQQQQQLPSNWSQSASQQLGQTEPEEEEKGEEEGEEEIEGVEGVEEAAQLEEELLDDQFEDLDEELDIPVSFALFLLITYMMLGAVVFSIWESWNFFDALYFVFISMSTIGFGDLVPQHPKRMIGTFAYLLFGLALTSMCINVVQEKIHATFLRAKMQIGEKMGFDLDQIMADDYYDSNSAYGCDDEAAHLAGLAEHSYETASCANSLAASQTNSQHEQQQPAQLHQTHSSEALKTEQQQQQQQLAGELQQQVRPKSKESLKWKKRSSGEQHGTGATSSSSSSSFIKRKISSSKRLARRTSPPTSPTSAVASSASLPAPLKSQLETIRMFNMPVQVQLDEAKQAVVPAAAPRINQPVAEGVRSFCEPLRRAFQNGASEAPNVTIQPAQQQQRSVARSSLANSRSLDSGTIAATLLNGSQQQQQQRPDWRPVTAAAIRASGLATGPQRHHSERARGVRLQSRSLNSSRRASVSHELSQLDDLIVALSCSPPERFGPLLGIPPVESAGRAGRSLSPQVQSASTKQHILTPHSQLAGERCLSAGAHSPTSTRRRGTSMMTRLPPTSTPADSVRRLVQSPSHHQLHSNHLEAKNGINSELALLKQRRESSLASSTRLHAIQNRPLNLSESQAALAELEAVKYSAL